MAAVTAARRLGSTEIAAVAALYLPSLAAELPKNKTACDVFNRLTWGFEATRSKPMARGLRMEQFGLDYYARHVGPWWRALPLGEWWTVADPRNPDFTASPDAYDSPAHRIVVELKTQAETWARPQWGEPGTDQMATRFLYQAQWLCARCDAEQAHVLAIFGHDVVTEDNEDDFVVTEPAIYVVNRDDEVVAQLDAYAERFLNEFVRPGVPPPVKPATNRRNMKAKLNERGSEALEEWQRRCAERAAALGTDDLGRPIKAQESGDEVGGGDGLR